MTTAEKQAKPKTTTYYVNGERQTTEAHKLKVREILSHAGFEPTADYRLVRENGNHTFTDPEEEVPLRDDERFSALFQGPTPTS